MMRFRIALLVAAGFAGVLRCPAMRRRRSSPIGRCPGLMPAAVTANATNRNRTWRMADRAAVARPFDRALSPEDIAGAQTPDAAGVATAPALMDLTTAPTSLWERIRHGFGLPDMSTPLVREQDRVVRQPPGLHQAHGRAQQPLPLSHRRGSRKARHADRNRAAAHDRKRLSIRSPIRAPTPPASGSSFRRPARLYGLQQNFWYDGRRDVMAATNAALDYLEKLYEHVRQLGSGARRLQLGRRRGVARDRQEHGTGLPTDYQSLNMPSETRYYIPQAAGGQEHHRQSGAIRHRARRRSEPARISSR